MQVQVPALDHSIALLEELNLESLVLAQLVVTPI
jgi:hypothetical protein